MLAVVKTPHTRLKLEGDIPSKVLSFLRKYYGNQLHIVNAKGEEVVLIEETAWYKKMQKTMNPAKAIKGHRELLGMTQEDLGKHLGNKSRQYISDLEHGRREISKELAKRLALVFDVSVERFL